MKPVANRACENCDSFIFLGSVGSNDSYFCSSRHVVPCKRYGICRQCCRYCSRNLVDLDIDQLGEL